MLFLGLDNAGKYSVTYFSWYCGVLNVAEAGKTTILRTLANEEISNITPTQVS